MKFKNTTNIRGKKSQKYSIIIPSAGMGKRMRSYGPKSLIKITPEKNIVENQNVRLPGYAGHKPMSVINDRGSLRPSCLSTEGEKFM